MLHFDRLTNRPTEGHGQNSKIVPAKQEIMINLIKSGVILVVFFRFSKIVLVLNKYFPALLISLIIIFYSAIEKNYTCLLKLFYEFYS